MSSGIPDRSQWKFDPDTGEPVARDSHSDEPSEQPFSHLSQARAPITGPLGPAPQAPEENVDTFRAPYQAQPSTGWSEQAPYQPYDPGATQGYAPAPTPPTPPPTQPYGYAPPQSPTQPYNYSAQPPTQPDPGYQAQYSQYGTPVPQPAPTEPKRAGRTPFILGLVALILLVGLGGGALFLWQNVFNRPAVSVERLLPANTLGYFSFDPVLEGQQKAAMDQIGAAFEAQPGFKEAWNRLTSQFTSTFDPSLDRAPRSESTPDPSNLDTLATYLGNSVTLAVLAPSSADLQKLQDATNNGYMEDVAGDVFGKNVAVIVDLDFNPLNKKGPISDLKQQADNFGKAELVEKYRDIEIRKFITNTTEVYFALLDNSATAVVGAKAEPLRVLIDGLRDNKTLKDEATFKALSGQVPQERIAALYLNLTEIYKQVQLAAPDLMEGQSVQNVSGAMLFTLSAANDGIQVDVASETDLSLMDTSVQVNPNARPDPATLNDIPADAIAFYAGTDLKSTLETLLSNLRSSSEFGSEIDAQIKEIETLGVNLEQDLIPLLGGDYAISVSLQDEGRDGQGDSPNPAVVFQLKLSEAAKMKDLLVKGFEQNTDANVEVVDVDGNTFYGDPYGGVLLGVAQDRFWFVMDADRDASLSRIRQTIANLGKGIGTTSQWNAAKAHLARDSNGLAYVDLSKLREYLEATFVDGMGDRTEYDNTIAPFVRPLKYFLLGSATQSAKNGQLSRNHTVMFLGISK
jgi:hypothetical protein